jgi:hypothetical protein
MLLLDELMPRSDVREHHRTVVRASPERVAAAIREADLSEGMIPKVLMKIRGLIGARDGPVRQRDFERMGFRIIAERPNEEVVIGLMGKFWTPSGGLCADVTRADFEKGPPPGQALAGWNFRVRAINASETELTTETRVLCARDARMKFRFYWLLIRPGSGLIRRSMLAAIKRHAESS